MKIKKRAICFRNGLNYIFSILLNINKKLFWRKYVKLQYKSFSEVLSLEKTAYKTNVIFDSTLKQTIIRILAKSNRNKELDMTSWYAHTNTKIIKV